MSVRQARRERMFIEWGARWSSEHEWVVSEVTLQRKKFARAWTGISKEVFCGFPWAS